MFRRSRWMIVLLLMVVRSISAQPTVHILSIEPDVKNQTILLDGAISEVKCVAKTNRPDARLQWTLEGPGRFDGTTTGIASFYLLPDKIAGTKAQVKITITATDAKGAVARDTVSFTIMTIPPTPKPSPAPTKAPSPTPTPQPAPEEASVILSLPNGGGTMVFLRTPGGRYDMGCGVWADQCGADETVVSTQVETFWIGQYEVTRQQWAAVMGKPDNVTAETALLPVENVSWNEIQEFIRQLMTLSLQYEIRLPTEAEWEYACRSGGQPENYAGGNDPEVVAWHANNSGRKAHLVGQKQPNGLGLYDLSGNVREWTQDEYRERLSGAGAAALPPKGTKVVRGGGWLNAPKYLRCSNREQYFADSKKSGLGFRLVLKKN